MRLLIIVILWFASVDAKAFLVPSDEDYLIYRDRRFTLVYPREFRPMFARLIEAQSPIHELYQNEFSWRLDETPIYVLASSRNQITNGFANIFPHLHTVFYGGGAAMVDEFAATSWVYTLLAHETAHLYQLTPKQGYSRTLKKFMGNATPSPLPPFSYMISPNYMGTPTFLLEGNATFNENRFGNGGRLYNGHYRALFLQLLKSGRITARNLINDHLYWPFTDEKYIVGAYFNLHLAKKFGVETTNSYFFRNSIHFVNPLQLDMSFRETFGEGYEELIQELIESYRSLADRLKTVQDTKVIATSVEHGGFVRSQGQVRFLTADGYSRPRLYKVNLKSVSSERMNIPFGRPFEIDGKIYVPSSQPVSADQIRFGLYGEGMTLLKDSLNQFVYDVKGTHRLYAHIPESFESVHLYHNGRFIDRVHSSALFTPKGEVAYFKQNGSVRELYIGERKITSYTGYYGRIVDIANNDDVYFIGATESGASLFRARGGVIQRVHSADTIVDAKFITRSSLVVAEVTDSGYVYKITRLEPPKNENPYFYRYFFDQQPAMSYAKVAAEKPDSEPVNDISVQEYSTFRNLRFSSIEPLTLGWASTGFVGGLQVVFSDPLSYHQLAVAYLHGLGRTHNVFLKYLNKRHVVNFEFGGQFEQTAEIDSYGNVLQRYDAWTALLGAEYPFFVRRQMSSALKSTYSYTYEDTNALIDPHIEREHSLLTELNWTRSLGYFLAMDSNSRQHVAVGYEHLRDADDFEKSINRYYGEISLTEDLFWQNYVSVGYKAIMSDTSRNIELRQIFPDLNEYKSTIMTRYTPETTRQYNRIERVSAGYKKGLPWQMYFQRIPLGLRRLAPYVLYQEFYGALDKDQKLQTLFHEWNYGVEFEFLLLHKFPMKFIYNYAEMNKPKGATYTGYLTFQRSL